MEINKHSQSNIEIPVSTLIKLWTHIVETCMCSNKTNVYIDTPTERDIVIHYSTVHSTAGEFSISKGIHHVAGDEFIFELGIYSS